jgi:outer membrane protein
MAQYHQPIYGNWDPYVGLGVSWILPVYSISGDLEDSGLERLEFDGDVGIALQIGTNYQLDNRWYANLDLRWTRAPLEARTRISGIDSPPVTLDVDPFTISLGFGYKF